MNIYYCSLYLGSYISIIRVHCTGNMINSELELMIVVMVAANGTELHFPSATCHDQVTCLTNTLSTASCYT